jgi:acyl-CoA thioester hydrolase
MTAFVRDYEVRWADLDPNAHMRHTAYMDYAAQARVAFLTEHGFGLHEFHAAMVGPVLFKETTEYLREVRANERISVSIEVIGSSANGKHFRIRHEIRRQDGELAARVEVQGAWLDLRARKVTEPPAALRAAMDAMPRSADWAEIVSAKS